MLYASYYNISTLPPPRGTVAAAVKAHPAATCTSMPQVEFTGTPIEVFEDFANAEACCELCGLSKQCSAWTAAPANPSSEFETRCSLFDSTVGQLRLSSSESATSGYVEGALTHFRNPRSSDCLSDETAYAVQELGLAATWCSKQCSTDADCPFDVPLGSTAKPRCLLQEPFKNMKRCVLVCTAKSDCGNGQDTLCMQTQHFDGVSICTYVNDEVSQKITEPRFVGTFSDQLLPGGTLGNTANRDLPITFCSNGTSLDGCLADSRVSGLNLYGGAAASSPRLCARLCDGYKYAGIQAGYNCFCGNSYGHQGVAPATTKLVPCNGDPSLNCGAVVPCNDVYALTTEVQTEQCATIPENKNLTIACEPGSGMVFTQVTSATFGALTNFATMCSATRAPLACEAPTATVAAYVAKQCVGKGACSLEATLKNFDPTLKCTTPLFLTASLSCAPVPQCAAPPPPKPPTDCTKTPDLLENCVQWQDCVKSAGMGCHNPVGRPGNCL